MTMRRSCAHVSIGHASWEAALYERMTKTGRVKRAKAFYNLLAKSNNEDLLEEAS
jgi:hypothetical protein